jgi:beta-glucosidase
MKLTADRLSEETKVTVNVDISNSGTRGGKEVVQLYISPCEGEYKRPVIELKGFEKIQLEPGEKKQIAFELSYRDFACYSPKKKDWYAKPGTYKIYVGKSANDLLLMKEIQVEGQELLLADTFDESTMLRQFVLHPVGKEFFDTHYEAMLRGMSAAGLVPEEMIEAVLAAGSQAGMDGLLDQATSILLDFSGVSKEEREALFQSMNE